MQLKLPPIIIIIATTTTTIWKFKTLNLLFYFKLKTTKTKKMEKIIKTIKKKNYWVALQQ